MNKYTNQKICSAPSAQELRDKLISEGSSDARAVLTTLFDRDTFVETAVSWLKSMEGRACLPSSCSIEYPNPDSTLPELRHLLLIDDVYTTGSTLQACFIALRTAFPPPIRISIATLGFVGGG